MNPWPFDLHGLPLPGEVYKLAHGELRVVGLDLRPLTPRTGGDTLRVTGTVTAIYVSFTGRERRDTYSIDRIVRWGVRVEAA